MKDVLLASVFGNFPSQKSLANKCQLHSQITRTYDKNALKSQASLIWDKQSSQCNLTLFQIRVGKSGVFFFFFVTWVSAIRRGKHKGKGQSFSNGIKLNLFARRRIKVKNHLAPRLDKWILGFVLLFFRAHRRFTANYQDWNIFVYCYQLHDKMDPLHAPIFDRSVSNPVAISLLWVVVLSNPVYGLGWNSTSCSNLEAKFVPLPIPSRQPDRGRRRSPTEPGSRDLRARDPELRLRRHQPNRHGRRVLVFFVLVSDAASSTKRLLWRDSEELVVYTSIQEGSTGGIDIYLVFFNINSIISTLTLAYFFLPNNER